MIKLITKDLLDTVSEGAKKNTRLRLNHNFHEDLNDSLHRMLNAMEPQTYVRPHRHLNPEKEEIFILLRGKLVVFLFDDCGNIIEKKELSESSGNLGIEIPGYVWHTILVIEPDTVIYEIKKGPYIPLNESDFAAWAPLPENREAVDLYLQQLIKLLK